MTATDDDMPAHIDFSKGKHGQFYSPEAVFRIPVHLDQDVQTYLALRASAKGVEFSDLVNDLLKRSIALIEAAK